MRERKFRAFSIAVATDLEARFAALSDDDRESLGELLGAVGRVVRFLSEPKSEQLREAGARVWALAQAALSLAAPVVGVGKEAAGQIIDEQLPLMALVAPSLGEVLRAIAPRGA